MMRLPAFLAMASFALAGCGQQAEPTEAPAPSLETTVDGQGEADAEAPAPEASNPEEPTAFEQSIPRAIRGTWRETDGPAPTAAQCDGTADGNIGKVLLVRADGFSIFETGGRLLAVADRSPGMIRATFDTTYADEPTTGDITLRVDPVAKTLTMIDNEAPDEPFGTRVYKRCP